MDKNISTRDFLRFLAAGGAVMAAFVAPNVMKSFKFLLKDDNFVSWKKFNDSMVKQLTNRLKNRGLVKTKIRNKKLIVTLTKKGKQEVLDYDIDTIKLKKHKNWDGDWRIVLFDIPEEKKVARDALRCKFKFLGMHQLQKSAFVYPYDCRKEVFYVANFYEVADHIFYLEAKIQDIEEKLKRVFGIY